MANFEDFKAWLVKIQNKKGLKTIRGKSYSFSLDEEKEELVFYIYSRNKDRHMSLNSAEAIFKRRIDDRNGLISHYQFKKDDPNYTMSASYIIPLIDDFLKQVDKK